LIETLKILDTFAGIGGFSYAAHELVGGFETTQFVEIDPFCQKVLKKHFPKVPCHDDIKTFTAYPGQYDVITGGFPCQDISVAGRREGITEQSRSGLFYELIRVIRLVRPKFVVMENVAAILNNGLDIVLGELSEAGYDAEWSIISASSLGAAHRRSRWWCVATVTNSNSEGLQRKILSKMESGIWSAKHTRRLDPNWRSYVSKPILPRGSYGLSNRVDRTKALGNSIVPSVAAIPLQRVHDLYFK
jgi:DNA (cytosine-5)-methyltransferase 1